MRSLFSVLTFVVTSCIGQAQSITLDSALTWTIRNNPIMKAASFETSRQVALTRGSISIPKTDASLMYGQYNSIQKNDNNISVVQTMPFPSVWAAQKKLNKELLISAKINERVNENSLRFEVRQIFNHLLYLEAMNLILLKHDSLMRDVARAVGLQYKTGESTLLAKTSAETRRMEIANKRRRNEADRQIYLDKLRLLCGQHFTGIQGEFDKTIPMIAMDSVSIVSNPSIAFVSQQISIAHHRARLEAAHLLPDLRIGYFNQTLIGVHNVNGTDTYFGSHKRFHGFQLGVSLPLWYKPFKARLQAAVLSQKVAEEQEQAHTLELYQQFNQIQQELVKNNTSLLYYRESALKASKLLRSQSAISFKNGEIDYKNHLLNLQDALTVEEEYLSTQYEYNQNVITINYLKGTDQ